MKIKILKKHNKLFPRALRKNLHGFFIVVVVITHLISIDHTLKNMIYLYFFLYEPEMLFRICFIFTFKPKSIYITSKKTHEPTVTKSPC